MGMVEQLATTADQFIAGKPFEYDGGKYGRVRARWKSYAGITYIRIESAVTGRAIAGYSMHYDEASARSFFNNTYESSKQCATSSPTS